MQIDLNVDAGEGQPKHVEAALLQMVTSVNIACGGHAGDEGTMKATSEAARALGVRIGAHPSYPDRTNFGRVPVKMDLSALKGSLHSQCEALIRLAEVEYIKPHGALYNEAADAGPIQDLIFDVCSEFNLPPMLLANSDAARDNIVIKEGFIDRRYTDTGRLVERSAKDALIPDPDEVAEQALRLAPDVDSLCIHSDTPGAVRLLGAARDALTSHGWTITCR